MRPDDSALRFDIVPFFHGNILDISEGKSRAFPHFISHLDLHISDPLKLSALSDKCMDGILSSNVLHLLTPDEVSKALPEWSRVVKNDGHIIIHVPKGTTPKSQWDLSYVSVVDHFDRLDRGFDLVTYQVRDDDSLLFVFKMTKKTGRVFSWNHPKPEKTCAVVRYGAFGDCIQASSILPWLKQQGYHITFYCSDHGVPVIQHDPHIDRFILQGRDEMPPAVLDEFWAYESKKYDKWVNLCESVEATLLASHDRLNHKWPNSVREKYMNINYVEFTHDIAEVPPPYQPKFYSTPSEQSWSRQQASQFGKRNILWSLSGSSVHKTWPHLDAVVARLMLEYRDVHVVMVGDEVCQVLEAGWGREPRVHCQSGKWSIREAMAFAEVADLIIGTETGLLNAAGSMTTPKIVTLSHSSEEMLTKHWVNVTALKQSAQSGCPKFPCRQMHNDWTHCMKVEDGPGKGTAACQDAISAVQMWNAVEQVLGAPQRMVA